jgi:hypothetical protein
MSDAADYAQFEAELSIFDSLMALARRGDLSTDEIALARSYIQALEGRSFADTLSFAAARIAIEWADLNAKLVGQFPEGVRPAVPRAARRAWRYVMILAWAHFIMIAALLAYAIATGQIDWRVG